MNFGHFLELNYWQDACNLLDAQIAQKKSNRTYNTLNFHYFDSIQSKIKSVQSKKYYQDRIKTSLFYGLSKEFFFEKYMTSKGGVGLRNFCFFSYPMMVTYYSIGLYLMRLTQQYVRDSNHTNINSFYGAGIVYDGEKLIYDKYSIYYIQYYKKFDSIVQNFNDSKKKNRVVVHLDVQNYFDNISIPRLLELITENVKPSEINKYKFDSSTKEMIKFYFSFLNNGALPQGNTNILSGFIGYLYMVYGDNLIRDTLNTDTFKPYIDNFEIARYVDDTYLSIDFKANLKDVKLQRELEGQVLFRLLHVIADKFHDKLGLRFNDKTKIWHPYTIKDSKELREVFTKTSVPFDFDFDFDALFGPVVNETLLSDEPGDIVDFPSSVPVD